MFFRFNVFTVLWALLVLFLTLTPGRNMPDIMLWDLLTFDKFAHFFFFSVLVFLLIIGLTKQHTYMWLRYSAVRMSLLAGVAYGAFIELLQLMVPGRTFDLVDLLANTLGCLLGVLVFYLVYKFNVPG